MSIKILGVVSFVACHGYSPRTGNLLQHHQGRIPLGRMGEGPEVASLICRLASEDLSFSTGACDDISRGRAAS